ncbi:hypothetical protein ACFVWR_18975 [Leifsonia sp. NPDC058292]|uniref:hypothetical protein n=1 Tax=Leifsonia sp. NPDC058292 TaxID=3346428 RepID=UPI0036D9A2D3
MLHVLFLALTLVGLGSAILGLIAHTRGMRATPYYGVTAAAFTVAGIGNVVMGDSNAYLQAVAAAVNAWLWWHSGGGDGTKRRLKSWASRFQGIRRTAPSHT